MLTQGSLPQSPPTQSLESQALHFNDESWILEQNPEHYTLQVFALSTRKKVDDLVVGYEQLAPFAIYTAGRPDKPLYVLVQGNYPDLDAARQARDAFPEAIQARDNLWIRKFGKVQELVRE